MEIVRLATRRGYTNEFLAQQVDVAAQPLALRNVLRRPMKQIDHLFVTH
jgi:hypothetical protein